MTQTQRQWRLQENELNSTSESTITENSRLALDPNTCLKNISVLNNTLSELESKFFALENENSALNTQLSDLYQTQTDLRQNISDLEMKFRILNEENALICQLLTSRKEQPGPQDWIRNKGRCYLISTLKTSFDGANMYCSNIDARLMEINSKEEQDVVSNALGDKDRAYRIGKCADREEASSLFVKYSSGTSNCVNCDSSSWRDYCKRQHPFICQKSAHLCPHIPEEIQDICQ
ncbi:CD209 antigen-like protein B [Hypanus sabinus]|uniref:CD209 antigen-like protein B n=1 Tax=Hypanus sabinus TaxID=79690 RepID=UPI0028C3AB5B|nr:CD209 antigen-like protein B [Hypanus sabinus]